MSNLEHAVALFRAGWHPFPLPAGKKFPPPTGVTGAEGVDLSMADLHAVAWEGNIGTRCPVHVVGIDVDDYGDKAGARSLAEFAASRQLQPLPPTWRSSARSAPSGIYWYAHPTGARLQGAPCAGVETIQRHHRYAVMPPSQHPLSGRYGWHDSAGVPSALPPLVGALPELPLDWVAALTDTAETAERRETPLTWSNPNHVADGISRQVDRALGRYVSATGSRHDSMHRVVVALVWLDTEHEAGVGNALDWLRAQFVADVTADGSRTVAGASSEFDRSLESARHHVATHQPRVHRINIASPTNGEGRR